MEWNTAFGLRIRNLRKRAGLTQEQVAAELNVARPTITAIEKGERKVSAEELAILASLYECSVNDLYQEGTQGTSTMWLSEFNDRERKEIAFAETYAEHYGHGTDGHIRLMVIAKMAKLLGANHEQNATD